MVKPLHTHESIERIEDPAETPVTLSECKEHLRITSTSEDAYITSLLNAAVSYTDGTGALGKAMVTQKWRQYVGPNPGVVALIVLPVRAVTKVGYYDPDGVEQTAILADFDVWGNGLASTVRPASGKSWPNTQQRPDAIWIEYEAGYGGAAAVPVALKHAIKMLVAHWYEHRENAVEKPQTPVPFGYDALIGTERGTWYG